MSDTSSFDLTNLEKKCVDLANALILKYFVLDDRRVCNISDINSDLIILLFENIAKYDIPDLLVYGNKEDEAHNVQAVIDTISLDLLGISLSHITGEDVVAGNPISVYNLLEVLDGVASYLKSRKHSQKRQSPILKRKITRRKKSHSPISAQSLKPLLEDFSGVDVNTRYKRVESLTSSSSSIAGLPMKLKHQRPASSRNGSRHQTLMDTGTRRQPSRYSSSDYPNSSSMKSRPSSELEKGSIRKISGSESRPGSEETDTVSEQQHTQSLSTSKSTTIESTLQLRVKIDSEERNKEPSEGKPASSERNIKRKISRLPRGRKIIQPSDKTQEVEELYEKNLKYQVRVLIENNSSYQARASCLKKTHLQNLRKPLKKSPYSCRKSFLLPHTLRRRSVTRTAYKRKSPHKRPSSSSLRKQEGKVMFEIPKVGFVQELFDEFPGLQLSSTIINHIRKKYQQHLLKMHKHVKGVLLKKPKTQIQAEEAARKQSLLSNLLKKDIQQHQHLNEVKEYKKYENKIKYRLRDARLQSAKMKQYCDEFQDEMRKKMQKRNFTEELILENLFKESLKIQKEQVDYLCQEVKETGEVDARQHLVYLDALENLYQTQFSMVSEAFATEKRDTQQKAEAEKQEINAMQREFQEELKHEIRFMQKAIVECMEDVHFREVDAEEFKTKLRNRLH